MNKKIRSLVQQARVFGHTVSLAQLSVHAANAAFFLLLSVFPAATLILALLRFLPLRVEDLFSAAALFLPDASLSVFEYIFGIRNPGRVISVSAVIALWSASRGTYGILRGLNRAYRLRETRGYVRVRIACLFDTLLLVGAILAALLLYVFGQEAADLLHLPFLSLFRNDFFRFLTACAILILLFAALYCSLPNHHIHFSACLHGAVFSGAGWMIFSWLYSFYINYFSNMDQLYGGLSAIAVTMLWLYICMEIFFLGAVINRRRLP